MSDLEKVHSLVRRAYRKHMAVCEHPEGHHAIRQEHLAEVREAMTRIGISEERIRSFMDGMTELETEEQAHRLRVVK